MAVNLKDVENLTLEQIKTGLKAKIDTIVSFKNRGDVRTIDQLLDELIAGRVLSEYKTKENDIPSFYEVK